MRYVTYSTSSLEQSPHSAPGSSYFPITVSVTPETDVTTPTTAPASTTATTKQQPLHPPSL